MSKRNLRGRSRKTGLPPGTLVHVGEKKTENVRTHVFRYNATRFSEQDVALPENALPLNNDDVTWIDTDGLHKLGIIENFGKVFCLHPLLLEDLVNTQQRPKIDEYDEYLYIVLRMLRYDEKSHAVMDEQVSLVIGDRYLLSFQEGPGDVYDFVRERIRTSKGRIRKSSADYLCYTLIDSVVDNYFIVLEKFADEIEKIETRLMHAPKPQVLQSLHHLKREMVFLRKAVMPLREVIDNLSRSESDRISDSVKLYFRDVYDHTIQILDVIESYRDVISGMIDIYMSNVSLRLNSVMKVLTVISTIFMPLTFISSIYGMNFEFMPELHWKFGYPLVLIGMAALGVGMGFYFKRKNWLD